MLQGINRIGRSWVGRVIVAILFGFLIVSFAIWGIGDIFRGGVRTQVATVGGVDISAEQYRNAYQSEFQTLVRRARRSITPEQARALGLEQRVLARLVSEAAFDNETKRLGLAIPDSLVVRTIQADPSFRGPDGAFSRALFIDIIRQSGLTEQQYVRDQRSVVARQQLAEGLTGAFGVPIAMREAVHRYQSERRSVELVTLTAKTLGELPAPTDAQLQSVYDDRKATFRAPEFRSALLMILDPAGLAKPEAVSDEDARAVYGRAKDTRFGTPERRMIQQIVFPTRPDADAAAERIKAGSAFEEIAKERGIDDATLNLGKLTKAEMLDPVAAETAFSLPEGGVSPPVAGRFGPVLIRVTAIEPGSLKPFEQVSTDIKLEIARERARREVETVHDAVEDQRVSAKPLAEIAKERNLPLLPVKDIDRSGRDKSGQPVTGVADREPVLAGVFRSDVGADNEAVTLPTGGYVWFEVTNVEPGRDRPMADIRDNVADEWRRQEVTRGLAEKANALTARLDKGEALSSVATELGLVATTIQDLARGQTKDNVAAPIVTRIFATPVGKAASAAPDDESRAVFKVTTAVMPSFVTTTQDSISAETQIRTIVTDDLLTAVVADVEKRIGVKLYPGNIRRAIGGES